MAIPLCRGTLPKIGALGKVSRRRHAARKNPPLATGPKFRKESQARLIRERALCCISHTQRDSVSNNLCPTMQRTRFHIATRNDRANQTKAQRDRGCRLRGSVAVCDAGRHGAGMVAHKNSGARNQHGDHSGKRQEFHRHEFDCHEFHCRRPPLRREVDSRSLREF